MAVGGSYQDPSHYAANVPHVVTDNYGLVQSAYQHLIETGLGNFAMFSLPESPNNRWAQEREQAFMALSARDGLAPSVFRGRCTRASTWDDAVNEQIAWLRSLPKPVGVIAVTDSRARQLLQACSIDGIAVPEEVALIGIDNDGLARALTRIPMSSVMQGAEKIGHTAAHLLDQMLHGVRPGGKRIVVPPVGINVQASSRHQPPMHRYVMHARHFIRQYACQGIKTEQVALYVGISRSSLESYFRQELGCSVHDAILQARLEAATAILQEGECNLADVAARSGFTSSTYLHYVFKRELGCTPRDYQGSNLQEDVLRERASRLARRLGEGGAQGMGVAEAEARDASYA